MIENVQALEAFGISQQVAANNVANMNTDGFHSSRVDLETGPNDRGVRVQDVVEISSAGQQAATEAPQPDETQAAAPLEPSDTDLATEMTQMIENEHAFAANVAAIRTGADMTGVLIDMMV